MIRAALKSAASANPNEPPLGLSFDLLFAGALDAVFIFDDDRRYIAANPAACELLGVPSEEIIGQRGDDFVAGETKSVLPSSWAKFLREGEQSGSVQLVRRDGKTRQVEFTSKANFLPGLHLSIVHDVTERHNAQQRLSEAEENYRRLVEFCPDGITVICEDKVVYVNQACLDMLGASNPCQVLGRHPSDFVHPDYEATRQTRFKRIHEGSEVVPVITVRLLRLDGTEMVAETSSMSLVYDGKPAVQSVMRDITLRRQAEEALSTTQLRLTTVLERLPDLVLFETGGGREFVTSNAQQLLGYTVEQLNGVKGGFLKRIHEDDRLDLIGVVRQWRRAGSKGVFTGQFRLLSHAGESRWVEVRMVRVAPSGDRPYLTGVLIDVTDRKTAEHAVAQSERLAGLGVLARGIAHDFNNLLHIILGNSEIAAAEAKMPSVQEALGRIDTAAQRGADLVRQIQVFSGTETGQREPTGFDETVSEMWQLLASSVPEGIEATLSLGAASSIVLANPSQLRQVVMNLVLNALEAMAGRGTLRVATEVIGGNVRLSVSDSGPGISIEVRRRMFEPFYSTKGDGRGMGLSVVRGIAAANDGDISVRCREGGGSAFRFTLPLHAITATLEPGTVTRNGGQSVVLIVDDEATARQVASKMVVKFGLRPMAVASHLEALTLIADNAVDIAGVLLDMAMPGIPGEAVLSAIREVAPELPVVVASGLPYSEVARRVGTDIGYLPKPFSYAELKKALRGWAPNSAEIAKTRTL